MRFIALFVLLPSLALADPHFKLSSPDSFGVIKINTQALCTTANHTLAYINKGHNYDPEVIHAGQIVKIPIAKVKATLRFICAHQQQMNSPHFLKKHFNFIRWYPDTVEAKKLATQKSLLRNLPSTDILMTKYYVHLARASHKKEGDKVVPLLGLPYDEQQLTLEQASHKPNLARFQYGKQAILKGAMNKKAPVLAYLTRDDFEAALLQGTVVADFGPTKKIFNVHRCNSIAYDKGKNPYQQERYWYFKEVDGIKGYGKDAEHKITVDPTVTFAADLAHLGLGKLLIIQYKNPAESLTTRAGILADTGGAFVNNLYQVDYLAGSFAGKKDYLKGTRHLPDYVSAYFMVLK